MNKTTGIKYRGKNGVILDWSLVRGEFHRKRIRKYKILVDGIILNVYRNEFEIVRYF